jgi:hypothetical protein
LYNRDQKSSIIKHKNSNPAQFRTGLIAQIIKQAPSHAPNILINWLYFLLPSMHCWSTEICSLIPICRQSGNWLPSRCKRRLKPAATKNWFLIATRYDRRHGQFVDVPDGIFLHKILGIGQSIFLIFNLSNSTRNTESSCSRLGSLKISSGSLEGFLTPNLNIVAITRHLNLSKVFQILAEEFAGIHGKEGSIYKGPFLGYLQDGMHLVGNIWVGYCCCQRKFFFTLSRQLPFEEKG